jgi:hypothetical protein
MKTTTLPLKHSMNCFHWPLVLLLNLLATALFVLAPATRAQCPQICDSDDNTALGDSALISLTVGTDNTAVGFHALYGNTTGNQNTATGENALSSNTYGSQNTAHGSGALSSNTGGSGNTANGADALPDNTTGSYNTAIGGEALFVNSTGTDNTAIGYLALGLNTTGSANTATGLLALYANTTADNNTATGFYALNNNTGSANTAGGSKALYKNTTGNFNTATGYRALGRNTTGRTNIAVGFEAGLNLTNGSNNIDIGNSGVQAESNTIRIGTVGTQTGTFIAGISGVTVPSGVAVIIDSTGHLGTTTSSARFKEAIKPMDEASEAVLALKPVTFRYRKQLDSAGTPQFGLIAEDVEKVNPDLVARDEEGKPYSVRYEAVNAMLLNEFIKAHSKIEEQGVLIARQQKQIEALTAGLQKVSAQLEVTKLGPQTVSH